jgi:hypothetical protein
MEEEKKERLETIPEFLKRNIRESLVYALLANKEGFKKELVVTTPRNIVSDFYASLNRKDILSNFETEEERKKAHDLIREMF